ncbi:MAG: hypothetical protein HY894_03895 [Deltaproteobacteria bacterium]|nr:hypothetical protein [Deltaproteobacteria bacterium]
MKKLESGGIDGMNAADPDCITVRGRQGTHAGYNGRIVADEKHGLYELPESRWIYALRKQKVELPFGHIKRNLGAGSFLLRGIEGARAEMALPSSCFHIKDDNNRGRCRASYETDGLKAAPQGAKRAHNQRIYMSGIE